MVTIVRQIKTNLLLVILTIFSSCSEPKEVTGASWQGSSDFMFISNKNMEMHYASSILGNQVYLGGFYEIIQNRTNQVINKIEVSELEFEKRTDGVSYCRIWGNIQDSDEKGYLLADACCHFY